MANSSYLRDLLRVGNGPSGSIRHQSRAADNEAGNVNFLHLPRSVRHFIAPSSYLLRRTPIICSDLDEVDLSSRNIISKLDILKEIWFTAQRHKPSSFSLWEKTAPQGITQKMALLPQKNTLSKNQWKVIGYPVTQVSFENSVESYRKFSEIPLETSET